MVTKKDFLLEILQRTETDPAFREAFQADPAGVLAEAGVNLGELAPSSPKVRTHIRAGVGPYPVDRYGRPTGMPICFG